MTPHVALVTAAPARALDQDLPPLESALRRAGAEVSIVVWDDPTVAWPAFDLALLRSTWDYSERLVEFLSWAGRAAQQTRLVNPLEVVRWNTDKHYLGELAGKGVAVVPSFFLEPRDNPQRMPEYGEFVVKPAIGAGSRDAQRYVAGERALALAHARRLLDAGRSVLIQPYLDSVDEQGETALIYFDGEFDHAIRKGPLLKRGEGPTTGLFAAEEITARVPGADELALGARALAAIPFPAPLLYARVDLIRDGSGAPRLLELELAEPSLFFDHSAGSAGRFAAAVMKLF
jgi:O-ureido-D-serine cyclo-ligase